MDVAIYSSLDTPVLGCRTRLGRLAAGYAESPALRLGLPAGSSVHPG
jgi:hypothetical protein